MKTKAVIARLRSDLADREEGIPGESDADSLWSNEDVLRYLNAAASVTASRTRSLFGTFLCRAVANDPYLNLHKCIGRVLEIQRMYHSLADRLLVEASFTDNQLMTCDYGVQRLDVDWENDQGAPEYYLREYQPGKIRLYKIPQETSDVLLTASYVPGAVGEEAEFPFDEEEDIHLVLCWAKKLAYEKQDADTVDLDRAQAFESEFEVRIVERESEKRRIRRRPQNVRYNAL